MQILLLSDTHGELNRTKAIIEKYPKMDAYIHLGDIGFPLQELSKFHMVCGNHDRHSMLPKQLILSFASRNVLCIHGNMFDEDTLHEVMEKEFKDGEDMMEVCMQTLYHKLATYAKQNGCDTLFFGHTHHQFAGWVQDVFLVNPGSVCFGSPMSGYAIIEINENDIHAHLCEGTCIDDDRR